MSKFNVGDRVVWNPFGKRHEGTIVKIGPLGYSNFDYAVKLDGNGLNDFLADITGDGGEWAWEHELVALA